MKSPAEAAFALQELEVCWDQCYEALARGDLDRVAALLDVADEHLRDLPAPADDSAELAELRGRATAASGRLGHGMRAGLDGLRDEIGRARVGQKMLQSYGDPTRGIGGRIESRV
jgi:hypothetical protein